MSARGRRPPEHLSERAQKLWREIAGTWELDPAAYELLLRLCEAADRADEARAVLEREGITTLDRFGQHRAHPAVAIERDARLAVARLTRELNLSEEPEEPRPPRLGRR